MSSSSFLATVARHAHANPVARALVTSAPSEFLIVTLRGMRQVTEPARFGGGQLTRRCHRYQLRTGTNVVLRHRSGDVPTMLEIFREHAYDPPPEVAEVLDSIPNLKALDVGGNVGLFGARLFEQRPDARLVSIEADPHNVPLLRATIEANGLAEQWTVIEAVALTEAGEANFVPGGFHTSHVAGAGEPGAIGLQAVDLFDYAADVDYMKMDIEGSEWPILLDERFQAFPASVLVLEWHAGACPEPEPLVVLERILSGAGYRTRFDPTFDWGGIAWAWRPASARA